MKSFMRILAFRRKLPHPDFGSKYDFKFSKASVRPFVAPTVTSRQRGRGGSLVANGASLSRSETRLQLG